MSPRLRRGDAPRAASGPRRDPARRNARPRDDLGGDHGGRDRAPRLRHAAHDGLARTVDRIIDQYPTDQQEQIRSQLAVSIVAVISQMLVPQGRRRAGAAFEIMMMNSAIENHIRKGETFKIRSAIETGKRQGNMLLDEHLKQLAAEKKIKPITAIEAATDMRAMEEHFGV
jgi:Tfp pilus assembly pilus retraction ATPase PilT